MYRLDNFGRTLLRLRKERGWTQTELAERIGIAPQSVSKWECAIGYPDVALFPVIAELFSVPIGVLFGDTPAVPDKRRGMERETPPNAGGAPIEYGNTECGRAMDGIFTYTHRNGSLSEHYGDGEFYFLYRSDEKEYKLPLYAVDRPVKEYGEYYCGYKKDEVLSSGRDILAERLLTDGDPVYGEVKAALPPVVRNTYTVLGGVSSVAGLTVDGDGRVYHQLSGRSRSTVAVFSPEEYDGRLGALKPFQTLVGREYPLLASVHTDGVETLEFLYFVEPTEPDRDPVCWIRIKRYRNYSPTEFTLEYRVAAIAREGDETELWNNPPKETLFLDALYETVSYWVDFSEDGAALLLPEPELARIARGSLAFAALTFTCEHAHYGHRFYGKELHDNFPPNYIFTLETLICLGRETEARGIFGHFLKYVLRLDGRINYRQGTGLNFGASAAEYGMLLHLFYRYRHALGIDGLGQKEMKKLVGMGEEIMAHLCESEELGGLSLIKMCAEADTNERVHVYMNNNLWAIRGLTALASLLSEKGERYRLAARGLSEAVNTVMERYGATGTRFGDLPPFRVGYTPVPVTLSRCEETFYPLSEEKKAWYYASAWERGDGSREEDLIENAYANYRYYPEMLSSMLLPTRYADAVVRMRENIGGEIMVMTRFLGTLDDWPVLNYARFLIETGRIEKYLLLLYSHAAHHGAPELLTYHEQVSIDGAAVANDCLPALMTVPLMTAWCFAYETVEGDRLRLLSALPKEWYRRPFEARGLGYSEGKLDVTSDGKRVFVSFKKSPTVSVELVWRARESLSLADIRVGTEYVREIRGNVICLISGVKELSIEVE